jgi:glucose/arabinose dehydrogenase
MPDAEAVQQDLWTDLQPLLDQELSRLPDKYRIAIVLCDLQGLTRRDAARQLGCPEGTVAGRLARARALLTKRLARHGLGTSAGVLAAALAHNVAAAAVPASVISSTINAASLSASGNAAGVIAPKVTALTEGVLKTMLLKKLQIATAVLVMLSLFTAGAGGLLYPMKAAEQLPLPKAPRAALQDPARRAADPMPVVVRGDAHMHRLAWSPDGKILATVGVAYDLVQYKNAAGEEEGTILPSSAVKLWDPKTGELKRALAEEKYTWFTGIAFSPDGKTAALSVMKHPANPPNGGGLAKSEVWLVDARTWDVKDKVAADGTAWTLAFSPDGTRLALGSFVKVKDGPYVKLYDVRKGKLIGGPTGKGGAGPICLAFSRDGKRLATGDQHGKVRLFDGLTGELSRTLEGHGEWVSGVGFFPDGKTFVSASSDKTLKLWDVESGKLQRTLEGNKGPVSALAFSRDGQLFATAGGLKDQVEVLLWDTKTAQVKKALPDQTMEVRSLAFSPDGGTLAIGAGNPVVVSATENNDVIGRLKAPGEFKLWKLK